MLVAGRTRGVLGQVTVIGAYGERARRSTSSNEVGSECEAALKSERTSREECMAVELKS